MNTQFVKSLLLLIAAIFIVNIKDANAGYINLSERETVIKTISDGERLWFLTRDEVGYYVGPTRVSIIELSNFSHLNLNFTVHNGSVYLFAVDGVAKYDIGSGSLSTLTKVDYRGVDTPLTYAISPQIYNDHLYFGWKNRVIKTDLELQNPIVIEAPPTKLTVNELYSLPDSEYDRNSLSSITSFIVLDDVFYIMTRRGSLMSFKDNGGDSKSTYLLGRHEIPSLDNSFTYEIHHDAQNNKLLIATTVGAVFYDLTTGTGGAIPGAMNGRILRIAKWYNDQLMLLGKDILIYDPRTNETKREFSQFPYSYITSYTELNDVKYFSTEFDGIVIDRGEGFFQRRNTSGSNNIELVMYNSKGDLAYLLESVIIFQNKKVLLPDSTNEIKIYSYKGDRLVLSDWFELYATNGDTLNKISHPFKNDTITDISLIDQDRLLITYKENTAQIYYFTSGEFKQAAEYLKFSSSPAVDEVFRFSRETGLAIKTKRASDIELIYGNGHSNKIVIPDEKYYLLESIQEQSDYFIFNYSPSLSISIDKKEAKHQLYNGNIKGHRCTAIIGNKFVEVDQKGTMYLSDLKTKEVKRFKLNELVTLNKNIVFHPSCTVNQDFSRLLISTSEGSYEFDIPNLFAYSRPIGKPYILNTTNGEINLSSSTSTINTQVVSTYPSINTGLTLKAKVDGVQESYVFDDGLSTHLFIEGLKPGKSDLELSFINGDESLHESSSLYKIANAVPFYKERYFLLVYILIASLFLYLSFLFIKRQQEKRATIEIARSKEKSLNAIAHDIKAPLTAIFAAKEMVASGALDKNHAYEALLPNVQVLQYISTNLLSINELNQRGELAISRSSFDALAFLSTAINASKTIADTKNIHINFCNTIRTNVYLLGDIGKITQSVLNVISNAVKYSKHNSFIDITSNYHTDLNELELIIQDYGKGVPKEDLPKITNIHQQASNSLNDGQGLGLYIASEICKAHGGTIEFKSELDAGTRVRMTFVCQMSNRQELETSAAIQSSETAKNYRIYLLEDDQIQANFFSSIMKKKGVQVTNFIEIDDFVNAFNTDTPDAVVTDHMIGHSHVNLTGLDVAKMIRKLNKQISIVAMTDQVDIKIKEGYEKLGCLYISKNASTIEQDADLILKRLDD